MTRSSTPPTTTGRRSATGASCARTDRPSPASRPSRAGCARRPPRRSRCCCPPGRRRRRELPEPFPRPRATSEPLVQPDPVVRPVLGGARGEGRVLVPAPEHEGELARDEEDLGQRAHLVRTDVLVALRDAFHAEVEGGVPLPVQVAHLALVARARPDVLVHGGS